VALKRVEVVTVSDYHPSLLFVGKPRVEPNWSSTSAPLSGLWPYVVKTRVQNKSKFITEEFLVGQ
jgi:hypothetical protein